VSWLGIFGGVLVGAGFGYVSRRGGFCLNSGFRNAVVSGDFTKLKALGLAVGLQLILLPVLFASGAAQLGLPAFAPVGAVFGGVLFGLCMRWAAGCAAGVVYKAGARSVRGMIGMLGMSLGAGALEVGPLLPLRTWALGLAPVTNVNLAEALHLPLKIVGPLLGVVLVGGLWRSKTSTAGAWTWRRTGMLLALVSLAAWPLSELAGRSFGLAVIPGAVGLVSAPLGIDFSSFDVAMVAGIFVGGWLASLHDRAPADGADKGKPMPAKVMLQTLVAGLGLGVGASLAGGCTVGHGITGLPLLAPGSMTAFAAIALGAVLTALPQRRARLLAEAS